MSVLEGGYNIHAGPSSTFARSVAAHVRVLAEAHAQPWDPADAQVGVGVRGVWWGWVRGWCEGEVGASPWEPWDPADAQVGVGVTGALGRRVGWVQGQWRHALPV